MKNNPKEDFSLFKFIHEKKLQKQGQIVGPKQLTYQEKEGLQYKKTTYQVKR